LEVGGVGLAPVGSFPLGRSPVGALDMAGNAREWTLDANDHADPAKPDFFFPKLASGAVSNVDPCLVPPDWETAGHTARGGGYREGLRRVRAASRAGVLGSDDMTGFRVALSADGSPRPRRP